MLKIKSKLGKFCRFKRSIDIQISVIGNIVTIKENLLIFDLFFIYIIIKERYV